jgi:hypothetical protein
MFNKKESWTNLVAHELHISDKVIRTTNKISS